ncbi:MULTISPECIES: hypothetical protein [unclassified Bradyrhizobium]|jgi:hypothetical protein|uniref:hypothetical protein n=1 Tax=unclassified Bradyrhizobium TaxID=2631580 RepID=UPI00070A689E|nr:MULTISPECIES: hypothetical protein [unclassified Bradyrhizobium]
MILRWLGGILGAALIGLGMLSALAFEFRYWRWRDCFNELGRCYDPVSQDVYLEQAGLVWGGLAVVSLLLGLGLLMSLRRRQS